MTLFYPSDFTIAHLKRGGPLLLIFLIVLGPHFVRAQSNEACTLRVTVTDSLTGSRTPVRIKITARNRAVNVLPKEAIAVMYGLWDHADGYGFQPDSSFYTDGFFEMQLPPGRYTVRISKGLEYLDQQYNLDLEAGKVVTRNFRMKRWIDMPQRGWYSADDHIHIRRSPREDSLLMKWIQAENLNVGVFLRMGDFHSTYYEQYAWGEKGIYQKGNHLLTAGQEDPRTPELGHALGIGASDRVRYQNEYYYYDQVFDKLHALGGLTGYAHQAETFHGYRGLVLDGLRNKVDLLEILQFCADTDPLKTRHYYHLLDLGFPLTAVAGSDFPWCGNDHDSGPPENTARIGNVRFYTFLKSPFNYVNWKKALAAGRTFVTSGPMISLQVNDSLPGTKLQLKKRTVMRIIANAYGHSSQVPLKNLDIISNGKVIYTVTADQPGQTTTHLSIDIKLPVAKGQWVATKCNAGTQQIAHSSPVYLSVDGKGFHNTETVKHYLQLSRKYLEELTEELKKRNDNPEFQSWRYSKGLEKRISEVNNIIEELSQKQN
jgi:hypothetical protein